MPFDQDRPIPPVHSIGDATNKYRFGEMKIGESLASTGWNDGLRLRRAAAAYRAHHPGWEYRSRREIDASGFDCIRVWRIS